MKTKYILHGGGAQKQNPENDAFFREILKDASNDVRILLVYFASDPERISANKAKDTSQFERVKGDKNITFEVAEEQTFPKQVRQADVIYLGGGTTPRLLNTLKRFQNLKVLFTGKTIAGESAGANF